MEKEITIWYDKKADFLEVMFEKKPGYFRDTENDAVLEKVDMEGNVIGFSISGVKALDEPLYISVDDKNVKTRSLSFDEQRLLEDSMRENDSLLKKLSEM